MDLTTNRLFLADAGNEGSATFHDPGTSAAPQAETIRCAKCIVVPAYGHLTVTSDPSLNHVPRWMIAVAEVSYSLTVVEFLQHFCQLADALGGTIIWLGLVFGQHSTFSDERIQP